MTVSERSSLPRLIVAVALLLFTWIHRHALGMSGFADDLGLLVDLSQRAQQGNLLADVFLHVSGPLWPGSTMWRPLPYASLALDAKLWGADAGLWRITNLLLHAACSTVAGLICCEMTQKARAGAVGFAVFLLIPWSPEVAIWLVGRFDGWATLGVLLALWGALKSHGLDRWWLVSLFAGAGAFASKESALITPAWITVIAIFASCRGTATLTGVNTTPLNAVWRSMLSRHGSLIVAHILLAIAYLWLRANLFPASSLSVYASGPQLGLAQLCAHVWDDLQFPIGLMSLAPVASGIVGLSSVTTLAIAWIYGQRSGVLAGVLFIVSVVIAVAAYFPAPPGDGDGYRLYYLATIGFALIVASAASSSSRVAPVALVTLLAGMALWQDRVTDEWQRVANDMKGAEAAIRRTAMTMSAEDYGLVLLPDHLGHIPFARNAQGALPKLAGLTPPPVDTLGQLVVFTPPQVDEWHRLVQESVVRKITSRSDAPPNPTLYFCFDPRTQTLQTLGFWSAGALDDWRRKWRESASAACPRATRVDG